MADPTDGSPSAAPPLGSVAEETARLIEALLGTAATDPADPADPADAADPGGDAAYGGGAGHRHVCASCGETVGEAAPSVCHLCPVCQLISVARAVSPQTVDRLADLAGALTQTLRDLAAERRAQTGDAPPADRHRAEVEDIAVADDVDDDVDDGVDDDVDDAHDELDPAPEEDDHL